MGRTGKVADGSGNARPGRRQMDVFLDALAESSNVAASARKAGISANAMYCERRRNPGFAARWHAALCEGFARLEAELLSEALIAPSGNVKDATLKSRAQKYRLGLSLLAAHRAAVRGARSPAGAAPNAGAKAKLVAKLDAMRAQVAAERAKEGPL
ncbi:hypothetical protein OVY29_12165 [Sphingopyxis sp. SE2]|jgi:hypothetical protein|uniref:hypothetical protein n=1 Tax=Sphingopyxis sp. SE2 TaxID=1586240 RepID=UPI0028C18E3F|nr:hypothetical protein [Sphingopyxis sp. SE2]MDT7529420.1 hypothetical protein [Sphingopyxis sp. SE2]